MNILVQFDRIPGHSSSYGDWTTTKRFLVTSGMTPTSGNALQDIGEANMGDPQTLVDFVQWGMTNYPADHYAVVLWDHGSGWRLRPDEMPLLKDVAYDDTSGGDALDMPELRSAMDTLSNGGSEPLDLVGFDACLMGMIEVDNQLIPYVDVRVGSEETEPWGGWPYDTLLSSLTGNPAMSASQLGTVIVDEYYTSYGNDETQSAVDLLTPYGTLKTAVNDFAVALINGVGSYHAEIATARANTQEFAHWTYVDLYDFAYQVNQEVSDTAINAAATAVMNAVNGAVIHEQHGGSWPGAHGISIYFPESESNYDNDYDGSTGWLQFTADTQWDEWLHAFYDSPTACNDPYEPNDSRSEATSISYGDTLTDPDICPAGDVDYYVFSGSTGDVIVADIDARSLSPPSELDSYLYLLDSYGSELTHNDDYDGFDSRIEYTLPADGTYYLKVQEYNHPNEGGPDYFYTISLALASSFDIYSNWASNLPTIDGHISAGEWSSAARYDITASMTLVRFEDGEVELDTVGPGQQSQLKSSRSPVTLYVMNDGTHLYLAFDDPNDAVYHDYDQVGVYFDDNPLPSDGQWTNTTCGHADGEGNFWILPSTHKFREIIAGPDSCTPVEPAPGVDGTLQFTSGHAQAEVAIDLTSSALRASPGDSINMYMWIYDYDTGTFDGLWPIGAVYDDPSTYRSLTLADNVTDPDIEVTPTSFDVTLPPGQSTQRTMTICNVGQGVLNFELSERDTTSAATVLAPYIRTEAEMAALRGAVPSNGENADSLPSVSAFAPSAFGHLRGTIQMLAWVLYTDYDEEYTNALAAVGQYFSDFTLAESTTLDPTTLAAELADKDVLLLPEPGEASTTELESAGNSLRPALQDFVNRGGTIVATCEWSSWQGFLRSAGLLDAYHANTWYSEALPVVDPGHSLAEGLDSTIQAANATSSYTIGDADAQVVVVDPDDNPVVVTRDIGAGHVVLIGYDYYQYNDDAARIIANAVQWVGTAADVPWLSENPISGTVPAGDCQDVTVTFDATGLSPGTYTADIIIVSNDPDESPFIVPVTLHVTDTSSVIMTIEDGNGSPGTTDNPVTISADNQSLNTTPIAAGEFWVVYDGSVGLTLADVNTTSRSANFSVQWTLDESDPSAVEAHILLYSLSGATIAPGTGPILELFFDVDGAAQFGDSSLLSFSQVLLADQENDEIPADFTDTGQFTIGCAKDGDIDDNGSTDIFDLGWLVNMILPPQPDYPIDWWCRADLMPLPNGDNQWDIFDLQRLVCLILGTCESGRGEEAQSRGENEISIGEVYACPGASDAFSIDCDNEDAISAAEIWFTYDSTIGLNVSGIATTSRTDGWTVAFSKDDSDPSTVEVHILLFNMSEWLIESGTGAILSVEYDVDAEASGDSPLRITQVNLSDADGDPINAKSQDGMFHINNPPNTPSNPSPADGATGVPITTTLSWTGGDPDPGDTVTYTVYLEANDDTPDNLISSCDGTSTPACDPGTLDYDTHYYWYVVAADNHGASTTGDTWDFTTTLASAPAPETISPSWGYINQVVNVTVTGEHFQPGATAKLVRGEADIQVDVGSVSEFQITGVVTLTNAAIVQWDLRVTNPDDQSGDLAKAFTVKERIVYLPVIFKNRP